MKTNDLHIVLPASKSLSNRWLIINHITNGNFVLRNLSTADDTLLLQALLAQLRHHSGNVFYCGNAGTVARFLLALLAVTPGEWTLTGDERLKQRPMAPLIKSLRSMGCQIRCTETEGCLPVVITGYMPQYKMVELDPIASSQFVSALLLIGPMLPNGITITLTDRAASRPYIDMTLQVLAQAGFPASVNAVNRVYRSAPLPPTAKKQPRIINIERDWSSAAIIYAAAALLPGARLRMQGLSLENSSQGDKITAELFGRLGVATREMRNPYHRNARSIVVQRTADPEPAFEHNFLDCPDLLPPVLVTCAALGVKAKLKGVKNLRVKESDRLAALQEELTKMGGRMTITANEVRLMPAPLHAVENLCGHGDHRIAMSLAVLSLAYPGTTIDDPSLVSKSFPGFWEQLEQIKIEILGYPKPPRNS